MYVGSQHTVPYLTLGGSQERPLDVSEISTANERLITLPYMYLSGLPDLPMYLLICTGLIIPRTTD